MRVKTSKDVWITEFHYSNADVGLGNKLLDEMKNLKISTEIYFDGATNNAVPQISTYKNYIQANP